MSIVRALRSAMAAFWAACRSAIDLQDCVVFAALVMIGVGCWWLSPALGLIAPGSLLLFICLWPGPRPPREEVRR
jgi:hypothetical protein